MPSKVFRAVVFTAAAVTGLGRFSDAKEPVCAHCGCHEPCQKVCRLICEEKKVEIVCWGSKCEEFCVPGPSKPVCKHKETVCDPQDADCGKGEVSPMPRRFVWFEWRPKGEGKMFTKTKLMKKIETKTIPTYKWVVEDLCPECQAKQAAQNQSASSSPVALQESDRIK